MKPFRNILRLSVGDFIAKTLGFLVVVRLARVLGVESYGVLEFAIALLAYFLLLADGGLELWATRAVAQGRDIRQLAARVVPLRLMLAVAAYCALLALLIVFSANPTLRIVLGVFGLTLFAQAANLKWTFMGQERMTTVAMGLVMAQLFFFLAVFALVHSQENLIWVPVLRVISDLAMAAYFLRLFAKRHGGLRLAFTLRGAVETLRGAVVLGATHGLALMSYNFDSVMLGFFWGAAVVGWYSAAYKPLTIVLAISTTYFLGLFPALSRTFSENPQAFREIVARSIRLTIIYGLPLGVAGTMLAGPTIHLLFGSAYANSVPALQVLSWSAVLVVMRGSFRQGLNAAHKSRLDLLCAVTAVAFNVCLNLVLIPLYGILGAALATVVAELIWLVMATLFFTRYVVAVNLLPSLLQPVVAAIFMAGCIFLTEPLFWMLRAVSGVLVYLGVLLLLGETEVRSWARAIRPNGIATK